MPRTKTTTQTMKSTAPQNGVRARRIRAKHFMNSAFKEFSLYDNVRSIPHLFDGLKPSQRKAVYGVQLRGEGAAEIQVERLAAQVAACVTGDTLIKLSSGEEIAIKDLARKFENGNNPSLFIDSYNLETQQLERQPILNVFESKRVDEIFILELENGQTIKATGDHKVLTTLGWKRVDELTHDDKLLKV